MTAADPSHPDSDASTPESYRWTPQRIAIAAVVLLFGLGVPAYVVWPESLSAIIRGKTEHQQLNTDNLTVPADAILSGGPPRDGIPSLRTEATRRPESASASLNEGSSPASIVPIDRLQNFADDIRVVGVVINDNARAYPIPILNVHEAVNDELGGVPVCVVFCPLCDSVTVVDRRMDGDVLEFGISGKLVNSNVLLYDRKDHALWSQVKMEAVSGLYAGRSLKHLDDWEITTLARWRQKHPASTVLSAQTGHVRQYDRNPYQRYLMGNNLMFPVEPKDDRVPARTRVIGVRAGQVSRAYPVDEVHRRGGKLQDTINGKPLRLESDAATQSIRVA